MENRPEYSYKLYRAGIKTVSELGEWDEKKLLAKGLWEADLKKIAALFPKQ